MTETDNTAMERLILFLIGAGLGALGALVTMPKTPGTPRRISHSTKPGD